MAGAKEKTTKANGLKLFMQNSSFHGIRYIAPDKDPQKNTAAAFCRRATWLLLVLGAITLFGYQVGDRAVAYFRHETSVNVELVYVEEMDFPAVTICNQNTFRLTKVVEANMYQVVSDVFSPMDADDIKSRHSNLSEVNTDNFTRATAHSRMDFIDRCTWDDLDCDLKRDFKQRVTDFGVCYTFNGDTDNVLAVKQSGAEHGLSLLLNIEQYEYMTGPQNDAGIKILLHSQDEEPLVKDLGFAVAPGSHTLVGVKISKVESLTPPWGLCERAADPYPSCKASCTDLALRDQCCTDMEDLTTNETAMVCNDLDYFICVYNDLDTQLLHETPCDCGIPCSRTVYEPSMSYAQLSKYTADQIIFRDPQKKAALGKSFLRAKETAQRVVPEVLRHNNVMFEAVLGSIRQYEDSLATVIEAQTNTEIDAPILNIPLFIEGVLAKDEETMLLRIADKDDGLFASATYQMQDYGMSSWMNNIEKELLVIQVSESWTHDITGYQSITTLEGCLNKTLEDGIHNATIDDCPDSATRKTWKDKKKLTGRYLNQNGITRYRGNVKYNTEHYHELIDTYFRERPISGDLQEHDLCLENLEKQETSLNNVVNALESFLAVVTVSDAIQALELAAQSVGIYYDKVLYAESLEHCNWMYRSVFGEFGKDDFERSIAQWAEPFSDLEDRLKVIAEQTLAIKTHVEKYVKPLVGSIEAYRAGGNNLTFYDLSKVMASRDTADILEAFTRLQSDFDTMSTLHFQKFADVFEPSILATYDFVLDTSVPIFQQETIENFEVVGLARRWNGSTEIGEALNLLQSNPHAAIQMMVRALFDPYKKEMPILGWDLQRVSEDISLAMADLQKHLARYIEETEVNEKFFMDNFLQVDIFYKQLSFEKVTQQKVFEFLSLLCEVGGFMGLLLGASVLTVFELIDHILISVSSSCQKDGKTSTEEEP